MQCFDGFWIENACVARNLVAKQKVPESPNFAPLLIPLNFKVIICDDPSRCVDSRACLPVEMI